MSTEDLNSRVKVVGYKKRHRKDEQVAMVVVVGFAVAIVAGAIASLLSD